MTKKQAKEHIEPYMLIDVPVSTLEKLIQSWDSHTEKNVPCGTCTDNPDCPLNKFFTGLKKALTKKNSSIKI